MASEPSRRQGDALGQRAVKQNGMASEPSRRQGDVLSPRTVIQSDMASEPLCCQDVQAKYGPGSGCSYSA